MKRILLGGLLALMSLVILSMLVLFLANLRARHKAESFLQSVRGLRVGKSTLADIQPVLKAYGGSIQKGVSSSACPDVSYSVGVGSNLVYRLASAYPSLQKAGFRPWGVSAGFLLKDNRLCDLLLFAGQQDDDGFERHVTVEQNESGEYQSRHPDYHIALFLSRGHIRGLRVIVTPKATPTELLHASEFNLSCLTSIRGCRALFQIAPLVAKDALLRHETEGLQVPIDEVGDPSCIPADAKSANN
jgi:hypothetical protein